MGEIGHGVCRDWGYKQKIRPLGQLDVRGNPVRLFILKGGKDRVAGNRVQGEGCLLYTSFRADCLGAGVFVCSDCRDFRTIKHF